MPVPSFFRYSDGVLVGTAVYALVVPGTHEGRPVPNAPLLLSDRAVGAVKRPAYCVVASFTVPAMAAMVSCPVGLISASATSTLLGNAVMSLANGPAATLLRTVSATTRGFPFT